MKRSLITLTLLAAALGAMSRPAVAGYAAAGLGFTNGTVDSGGFLLTPGGSLHLGASTSLNALYLYNNAANTDSLSLSGFTGTNCGGAFFANATGSGCTDSVPGTPIVIPGLTAGQFLNFTFNDVTASQTYLSTASSSTTHFAYDTTSSAAQAEHDFNLPPGSLTGNPALVAALLALGPNTVVVAIEDLPLGLATEDYNDLVFAFSPTVAPPSSVPEPASLALLGAGLAGIAGFARRRRNK